MNGDIYLRQQPASRQCQAIVVAVDHVGPSHFPNVARDGTAWTAFLTTCGFTVTHLVNPTHREMIEAIGRVSFKGSAEPPGPGTPAKVPGAGKSRTATNSCLMFFFSGGGSQVGRDLLLLASDSLTANDRIDPGKTLQVADLASRLREAAAASVLVLDTAFPDVTSL